MGLQWDCIERVFDCEFGTVKRGGKVEKKKRSVVRKVEKAARKMIELEAEEDYGWESVDSIE